MIIEIYTKDACPYCIMAKEFLQEKKIPYTELKLNIDFPREAVLAKFEPHKTFPFIVVDNVFVGGYIDFIAHMKGLGYE